MQSLLNLLAVTAEDPETGKLITTLTITDALIYALIGFLVTFLGILIIIAVIWIAGFIIRKSVAKKSVSDAMQAQYAASHEGAAEDVGELERIAIIAAIAAYYEKEESSVSEFKVRRIKRL